MNWLLAAVAAVVLVLALLVARGMWLIGQGTEAEMQARDRAADSTTAATGWALLDALQSGNIPIVSTIERWLGWDDSDETPADGVRVPQSALMPCPECGSKQALRNGVADCPQCGENCLRAGDR